MSYYVCFFDEFDILYLRQKVLFRHWGTVMPAWWQVLAYVFSASHRLSGSPWEAHMSCTQLAKKLSALRAPEQAANGPSAARIMPQWDSSSSWPRQVSGRCGASHRVLPLCQLWPRASASAASKPSGCLKSSPLMWLKLPHMPQSLSEYLLGTITCTSPEAWKDTVNWRSVSKTTFASFLLILMVPPIRLNGRFFHMPFTWNPSVLNVGKNLVWLKIHNITSWLVPLKYTHLELALQRHQYI